MEGTGITSKCALVARCGDEVLIMACQVRERHTEIEVRELAEAEEARDAEETTPAEPVEDEVAAPA
jgi:hypothetical protein